MRAKTRTLRNASALCAAARRASKGWSVAAGKSSARRCQRIHAFAFFLTCHPHGLSWWVSCIFVGCSSVHLLRRPNFLWFGPPCPGGRPGRVDGKPCEVQIRLAVIPDLQRARVPPRLLRQNHHASRGISQKRLQQHSSLRHFKLNCNGVVTSFCAPHLSHFVTPAKRTRTRLAPHCQWGGRLIALMIQKLCRVRRCF